MTRTGYRAGTLRSLLTSAGTQFTDRAAPLRQDSLPSHARQEVARLYSELGGVHASPRLAPGGWDLATTKGLMVELDEQFHFTRYRALTLSSPFVTALPWAEVYLTYCARHETAASRGGGGRWTSPSTERMFGQSDPPGTFGERGSARGKQRALYDAMKDLAATAGVVRLARISIYDQVGDATVDDILYGRAEVDPAQLREFVESRTHPSS